MKRLFVIGAGASGLMAAVSAAREAERRGADIEVTVLEHKDRPGVKLSQTGNGRCNLTNVYIDDTCYQNHNTSFVMNIINKFTPSDTVSFFASAGMLTKTRSGYSGTDGLMFRYVYPNSDQASTVTNTLAESALELGIRFVYEVNVDKIKKENDIFIISGLHSGKTVRYSADAVVVAAGSGAFPKTGSDGSGYKLAAMCGHGIIKPLPALVPLEASDRICGTIAGVRCDAALELCADGKSFKEKGELQFTDHGISGIPVFQLSRHAVAALDRHKKVRAHIDLLPGLDTDGLKESLKKSLREERRLFSALCRMMNKKLAMGVLQVCNISQNAGPGSTDDRMINITARTVKDLTLEITGFGSFDRAQVCSGGVDLEEIDRETLESKLLKGLYFCGEILDVDGICGGYNLQWAWSSGYTAGSAAVRALCGRV